MEDYVKDFLKRLEQEEPAKVVEIADGVRKHALDFLDAKILTDKENLAKLEATASKIRDN